MFKLVVVMKEENTENFVQFRKIVFEIQRFGFSPKSGSFKKLAKVVFESPYFKNYLLFQAFAYIYQ